MNLGVDIIEIARVNTALMRSGNRLAQRLLTPAEQQALGDLAENVERLAGFWAAKEAAVKALGTGSAWGSYSTTSKSDTMSWAALIIFSAVNLPG